MPAKRYSLNKNQTAINNGRDFISEGTKEKYCREFLRDRLLVQARMMGNFKEMSQDLSKKFKRHLVYRSAEASIQGSGRNLVISLPPAPRLKLYTANEYLKSYIKRANLEYLQTKEVANNRRNARLLTHVK